MSDITILKKKEGEEEEKCIEDQLKENHLKDQAQGAREFFSHLQSELDEVEGDLKDGLSYLDMKNDTLLSYMIDLCNIILRKVRGETISGHASVERCVKYRVILEKIKAIDQRIAYQLNKVISLPDDAPEESQGINLDNLDIEIESTDDEKDESSDEEAETENESSGGEDDSEDNVNESFDGSDNVSESENDVVDEDEDEDDNDNKTEVKKNRRRFDDGADTDELRERLARERTIAAAKEDRKRKKNRSKDKKNGVYKPPKLRSVSYNEGTGSVGRDSRRRDYNDFYQDDDEGEIVEETRNRKDDARTRFEEDNYTRLPDDNPKKAKRKMRNKFVGGKGKKKFKGRR